jgi:two-component system, cell cycle sensor histidine kinase and response regulator CckA
METVLVVDDDAQVLAIVRKMLEGYQILSARSAEEAVRVAMRHDGVIHLLLTDIVMPGTNGRELAQQLTLQRPDMKVLFMTAFRLGQREQQYSDATSASAADDAVILKPFTGERLNEKVREALTVKPPASPFDRPADPWRNV